MIYNLNDHLRQSPSISINKLKFDDIIRGTFCYAIYVYQDLRYTTREGMKGTKYYRYTKHVPSFHLYIGDSSQPYLIEGLGSLLSLMLKHELKTYYYMENNFDPIIYSVGDKVIARNKTADINGNLPKEEIIDRVETMEFSEGKFCQVIYFVSNPKSFQLALNYEPTDPELKIRYDERMKDFTITRGRVVKGKSTPKVKVDSARKAKIKNFLNNS